MAKASHHQGMHLCVHAHTWKTGEEKHFYVLNYIPFYVLSRIFCYMDIALQAISAKMYLFLPLMCGLSEDLLLICKWFWLYEIKGHSPAFISRWRYKDNSMNITYSFNVFSPIKQSQL